MAKREIPDFDRAAAFDEALAKKKPELVARLGGGQAAVPVALVAEAESISPPFDVSAPAPVDSDVPLHEPAKPEATTLKLVSSAPLAKSATKRQRARRRGVVARANGQELRRLTVYVDLGLAQRLRKHCFDQELNLSEVAAEALGLGLDTLMKR